MLDFVNRFLAKRKWLQRQKEGPSEISDRLGIEALLNPFTKTPIKNPEYHELKPYLIHTRYGTLEILIEHLLNCRYNTQGGMYLPKVSLLNTAEPIPLIEWMSVKRRREYLATANMLADNIVAILEEESLPSSYKIRVMRPAIDSLIAMVEILGEITYGKKEWGK